MAQPGKLLLGLLLLALLWLVCTWMTAPVVEQALGARATGAIAGAHLDQPAVTAEGRDITLSATGSAEGSEREHTMLFLVANYWPWMVVALVLGGAVGWSISPGRRRRDLADRWLWWAAAVFIVGLVAAIFRWLPGRPGLYLETLLLLSFAYMVGYLIVRLLHGAMADDRVVASIASGRSGPAVASAPADRLRPSPTAAGDARVAKEARRAADANAAEEAKRAADANAAEEAKRAADAKAAEEAKRAADAKAAEEAKHAVAAKAAEEAKHAADAKAAEEAKRAVAARAAEEAKRAADAKASEQAKRAADAKASEQAKRAADAKAAEEAKRAADAKAAEQAKRTADAEAAEQTKRAAGAKVAEETRRAADAPAPAASHPGAKPPGVAAPHDGQADDLKHIKGIGPKNEKVCNDLGVFHFSQIADWTADEAIWVGHHIAFPGRIEREHWIAQARLLAAGGETEHSAGVRAGTITVDEKADAPLDSAAAAALGDSLPRQAPPVEGESKHPGRRPYGLAAPLGGQPDDLKRIKGIGPKNEERLHALGIWRLAQIAAWTPDNVKWVGAYLAFPGRIDRERWIAQAKELTRAR